MNSILDLGTELLVDRSTIADPFLRLIVAALGETVLEGSAWVSINKENLARAYSGGGCETVALDRATHH